MMARAVCNNWFIERTSRADTRRLPYLWGLAKWGVAHFLCAEICSMAGMKVLLQRVLLISAVAVLTGCIGTSHLLYSKKFSVPSRPITQLRVAYIETSPKKIKPISGITLPEVGYNDLPELFRERVPLVFAPNGIASVYATAKAAQPGQKDPVQIPWPVGEMTDAPYLLIQIVDGNSFANNVTTVFNLDMRVNLYDSPSGLRIWTSQFQNVVTKRAGVIAGFDNDFTDRLLMMILEQMAEDGVIKLPGNRVKAPVPAEKRKV